MVSWRETSQTLSRLGLKLPTEAQWEYAARGGTTTVFWTGTDVGSLADALNLADGYSKTHGGGVDRSYETRLNDGFTIHAPVGSFLPNPFGLHDVLGNVWEWCRDHQGSYTLGVKEKTGLREASKGARVFRGGSFSD